MSNEERLEQLIGQYKEVSQQASEALTLKTKLEGAIELVQALVQEEKQEPEEKTKKETKKQPWRGQCKNNETSFVKCYQKQEHIRKQSLKRSIKLKNTLHVKMDDSVTWKDPIPFSKGLGSLCHLH